MQVGDKVIVNREAFYENGRNGSYVHLLGIRGIVKEDWSSATFNHLVVTFETYGTYVLPRRMLEPVSALELLAEIE